MSADEHVTVNAANALLMMADRSRDVTERLAAFDDHPTPDNSEDEEDDEQPCPVMQQCIGDFRADGSDGKMITSTNFSLHEFDTLWDSIKEDVELGFASGRGRKFKDPLKDIFFMTLTVLKHRATWEWHAIGFNKDKSSFKRMIEKMLIVLHPLLRDMFLDNVRAEHSMEELRACDAFQKFPSVLCATDVVFQDANRPPGNIQEAMPYYSKKHGAYGYKTEISVLANGQAVFCSRHEGGATPDVSVYRKNIRAHKTLLTKTEDEKELEDHVQDADRWEDMLDKGYTGLETNNIRAIIPKKKPPRGRLTSSEKRRNLDIASGRVIVENYFGRRAMLWGILCERYRLAEAQYDMYLDICAGLTNFHIRYHPLRASDQEFYKRYRKRIRALGIDKKRRRQRQARASRRNNRRRIVRSIRARTANENVHDGEDEGGTAGIGNADPAVGIFLDDVPSAESDSAEE